MDEVPGARLWHAARPHSLLLGTETWDHERARQERGEALAELNGWTDEERDSWLAATAPAPVQLRFELLRDGRRVAGGERPVLPGDAVTLGRSAWMPVVHDFNIEIAQTASIADPEIRPSFTGAQCGAVILPVADRGWWMELAFAMSTPDPSDAALDLGSPGMQGKRRDARQILEFSGSLLLTPGQASEVQLPDDYLLRMQIDASPGVGQQAAGRAIRVDAPTLGLDPGMQGLLENFSGAVLWADPTGLLLLDADTGGRAAAEILRAAAAVPQLEIQLRQAEGDAAGEALLGLRGISGRSYHFATGLALDAVVDWEVEVASSSRAADPMFERLFAGWSGSVEARVFLGEVAASKCRLLYTELDVQHGEELVLAEGIPAAGDRLALPAVSGRLDQIRRLAQPLEFMGALADFRISNQASGADGAARSVEMTVLTVAE